MGEAVLLPLQHVRSLTISWRERSGWPGPPEWIVLLRSSQGGGRVQGADPFKGGSPEVETEGWVHTSRGRTIQGLLEIKDNRRRWGG
jgi:hypothetical protein